MDPHGDLTTCLISDDISPVPPHDAHLPASLLLMDENGSIRSLLSSLLKRHRRKREKLLPWKHVCPRLGLLAGFYMSSNRLLPLQIPMAVILEVPLTGAIHSSEGAQDTHSCVLVKAVGFPLLPVGGRPGKERRLRSINESR